MSGGRFEPTLYNGTVYIYMVYACCMVNSNFNVYNDVKLWCQIP